jgi:CHAT domain-containing protein
MKLPNYLPVQLSFLFGLFVCTHVSSGMAQEKEIEQYQQILDNIQKNNRAARFDDSIREIKEKIRAFEQSLGENHFLVVSLYNELGYTNYLRNRLPEAIESYQLGLKRLDLSTNPVEEKYRHTVDLLRIRLMDNLAYAFQLQSDYRKAQLLRNTLIEFIDRIEATSKTNQKKEVKRLRAIQLVNQIQLLIEMSAFSEAKKGIENARTAWNEIASSLKEGETLKHEEVVEVFVRLHNLEGEYFRRQRDWSKALPSYLAGKKLLDELDSKRKNPKKRLQLAVWQNVALAYANGGDIDRAIPLVQECEKLLKDADIARTTSALIFWNNCGAIFRAHQMYSEANQSYDQALEVLKDPTARKLISDPDAATVYIQQALLHLSEKKFQRAAQDVQNAGDLLLKHIREVIAFLPPNPQNAFFQTKFKEWFEIVLLLATQPGAEESVKELVTQWLLNGKGMAFDLLAARQLIAGSEGLTEEEKALVRKLNRSREELTAIRANALFRNLEPSTTESYRRELERDLSLTLQLSLQLAKRIQDQFSTLGLDSVRRSLPKNSALVSIVKTDLLDLNAKQTTPPSKGSHYLVFVIPDDPKKSIEVVDLGLIEPFDKKIQSVVEQLKKSTGDRGTIRSMGEKKSEQLFLPDLQQLSQQLLHPLMKQTKLQNYSNWVINPDGFTWLLPWQALLLEDGKYVVENHAVSYVTSVRQLIDSSTTSNGTNPLIIADVDYGDTGVRQKNLFKELQCSLEEAEDLLPVLNQLSYGAPKLLTSRLVTKAKLLQMQSPSILFVSTHGYYLPWKVPIENDHLLLDVGLAITDCNVDRSNGILTGLEISSWNLKNTSLVYLSACDSGTGKDLRGQGVWGLHFAFQLAGAKTVLATQWPIFDKEAPFFATEFFKGLQQKKTKAEALREAQVRWIGRSREKDGHAHPAFWAPFILNGQWK